jgi:hypothetical protein
VPLLPVLAVAGALVAGTLLGREVIRLRRHIPEEPLPDDRLVRLAEFDGHLLADTFVERLKAAGIPAVARSTRGSAHWYQWSSMWPWMRRWEVCVFARDFERAEAYLPAGEL